MDVVFVRHGRTVENESGRFGGITDTPISFAGAVGAAAAAKKVEGRAFAEVYSSPLKRAVQTSEILGIEGWHDDRLKEINFGVFEGMSYEEILERYPDEAREWTDDYINFRIPDGESLRELYERVGSFLDDMEGKNGTVLVVTHEGVIKCALCCVLGSLEHFYRFRAEHCRFTQIAVEDGYRYIKSLNSEEIY